MSAKAQRSIKASRGDLVFSIINYLFLILLSLLVLYPLIYVLSSSFSSPHAVTTGKVWLYPVEPTLVGYKQVFKNPNVLRGYWNSIVLTVVGTSVNIVLTVMLAYPLSVRDFAGRKLITAIVTFTMLFNGGLVPTFILVNKLHLFNTIWALILPTSISVYNTIIARTYFQSSIPYDLYESATLDGCSDIRYIFTVVLPLSKAILAVLVLYYAVGHWNSYFNALIYLKDSDKYPLQVVLRSIIIEANEDQSNMVDVDQLLVRQGLNNLLKYCLIVVASVPMLILYPFIQKYFVKGVMIGALKG